MSLRKGSAERLDETDGALKKSQKGVRFARITLRGYMSQAWDYALAFARGNDRSPLSLIGGFSAFMVFSEAIEKFNKWRKLKVKRETVRGYDLVLRQFCLFVKNRNIEEIEIDDVTQWFGLMEDLNWDYNSFVPKAMALKKFFEFYHKLGYKVLDQWLIPVPRKEPKVPRIANEENYQKLLAVIPRETKDPRHIRNLALITMLWDTGARIGELLALDVGDLDQERRRAVIKTEKSQGRRPFRELFWSPETNQNLSKWIEKREHLKKKIEFKDPDALFISATSWKNGMRLQISGVGEMLRRNCARANISFMNAHSFRHHKGHYIVNNGGSASDVMNILGHASLQSSSIYTMMTDKELEKRARKFMSEKADD